MVYNNYENNAFRFQEFSIIVLCIFALSQSHILKKKILVINKDKNLPQKWLITLLK